MPHLAPVTNPLPLYGILVILPVHNYVDKCIIMLTSVLDACLVLAPHDRTTLLSPWCYGGVAAVSWYCCGRFYNIQTDIAANAKACACCGYSEHINQSHNFVDSHKLSILPQHQPYIMLRPFHAPLVRTSYALLSQMSQMSQMSQTLKP